MTRKWVLRCAACELLDYTSEIQLTTDKIVDLESRVGKQTKCPNCGEEELEVEETSA
ncbi:MAG: hypothetical protein ACE5KO_06640 [Candidatus Bathyarchaeia archaeon]